MHADYGMVGVHIFPQLLTQNTAGPIVRINPHEIHINDPEYIEEVYAGPSKKRDKYRWIARMLGSKLCLEDI